MKHDTFILDENVLKAALRCSQMANTLFNLIFKNKHRIAADQKLLGSYWDALHLSKGSRHHPFLLKIISSITRNSSTFDYIHGYSVDDNKILIRHRKDTFLAQIALQIKNRLICVVCKDKKTREDLNNKMKIMAVSLRDSIQYASQTDC